MGKKFNPEYRERRAIRKAELAEIAWSRAIEDARRLEAELAEILGDDVRINLCRHDNPHTWLARLRHLMDDIKPIKHEPTPEGVKHFWIS